MAGIDPTDLEVCLRVLGEVDSFPGEHPDAQAVRSATARLYKTVKRLRRIEHKEHAVIRLETESIHQAYRPRRGRCRRFSDEPLAFDAELNGGQFLAGRRTAQGHQNRERVRQ